MITKIPSQIDQCLLLGEEDNHGIIEWDELGGIKTDSMTRFEYDDRDMSRITITWFDSQGQSLQRTIDLRKYDKDVDYVLDKLRKNNALEK